MVHDNLYSGERIGKAVPSRQATRRIGVGSEKVFVEVVGRRLGINLAQDAERRVPTSSEQLLNVMWAVA